MARMLPGVVTIQTRVAAPLVKLAFRFGLPDPGDALLETTERDTGRPRVTPVCDCLEGNTFWIISQRGRDSEWMRTLSAGHFWRRLCLSASQLSTSDPLTVRIDLDARGRKARK